MNISADRICAEEATNYPAQDHRPGEMPKKTWIYNQADQAENRLFLIEDKSN